MRKKTLLAAAVIVNVTAWVAGRIVARRLTEGDAGSDDFSLAAIMGGVERVSTAAALRRGRVVAACGGVELDLRQAGLDPAGADLLVQAYCGGVHVSVPADWRVEIEQDSKMGGVDGNVTPREDLPDDAPTLRLEAIARMGGVAVSARKA